ncbi:MAG: methyltransferase domain-containing protein [Anaerolineae bacterium]|nr:methyltransferase domain-containing protein [Anaerolineae bacterium]MDW8067625.1 methyltransferase domain-containing protein [Anaerolineae bacterium]
MGESAEPPVDEAAASFDRMAADYDTIWEFPWYAWLFTRLHVLILHNVIQPYAPRSILDVGCGTGIQSFFHAAFGAHVQGIDISPSMIRVARTKAAMPHADPITPMTMPGPLAFLRSYYHRIREHLHGADPPGVSPTFQIADARHLPFRDHTFDHVNCCGSVLSLVPEYGTVLTEIARVLKPGGTLFLEAEGRWNGDLFWTLADALSGGHLGYRMPWRRAIALVAPPLTAPVTIDYPFEDNCLKLTLFTRQSLQRYLQGLGLRTLKTWTIHSLTNLIPSPLLHRRNLPVAVLQLFRVLAYAEERIPLALPGCSLVFLARKEG